VRTIRILLPMPLDEIKPFANLVDKLRTLLSTSGYLPIEPSRCVCSSQAMANAIGPWTLPGIPGPCDT
jgi:hypothetical protein